MTVPQNTRGNRLTTKKDWKKAWINGNHPIKFDPTAPFFKDIHKMLRKTLPHNQKMRLLEIGCYPGTYMWYFHKYFAYQPSGLEYVESCAQKCAENMKAVNIDAEIIHADLFDYKQDDEDKLWDVIVSVGFIEHFIDTETVIQKHMDLLKLGGHLILIIPNHHGLNGKILKFLDKEKYDIHNRMSYDDMKRSLESSGQAEIIEGGYYGHMGFWNTDIYPRVLGRGKFLYCFIYAPLRIIEYVVPYLVPNTAFFSPNAALVARKI